MIFIHFETEKGKLNTDQWEDLFDLVLIDGREQEFLDRWGQILRDIGDPGPDEKTLRARFHLHCLSSTMMEEVNK